MGMYSLSAEVLLLGTAAHESHLGEHLQQVSGPARGIYQMEPWVERDIWDNYLAYRPGRAHLVTNITGVDAPNNNRLTYDCVYSTVMARLHYRRVPEFLPPANDLTAIASYWKQHYNTFQGKGTVDRFIADYHRLVYNA